MIKIRRLRIGEAELFKQVRLMALQDAPYAFSSTYAAALGRSPESWREQADSTAQGPDRATFIAFSQDAPVGMAALYRREDQPEVGELIQVWIMAEYRGTALARDLMDAVFKWAGENHFRRVLAGLNRENARALKFYTRYGFSILDESPTNQPGGVYLVMEVK